MTSHANTFDSGSAVVLQANAGGSPHHAYQDKSGVVCLVCEGPSASGGVAVNEKGLEWIQRQTGNNYIRLINRRGKFDYTVSLDQLPLKAMRDGDDRGRFVYYDPADFGKAPAFPGRI